MCACVCACVCADETNSLDVPGQGSTMLVQEQMFAIEDFHPTIFCFQSACDRKHRLEMNKKNRESIMDDKITACRKDEEKMSLS